MNPPLSDRPSPAASTSPAQVRSGSRGLRWLGWIVSFVPGMMLLAGGVTNLFKPAAAVEGTFQLGFPERIIVPLGIVLAGSALLYLIPRTAVLGAILLTGYLGGAAAAHVRVGDPLFSRALFPVYLGAMLWIGLLLRDRRLRTLLPLRSPDLRQ